MIEVAVDIAVKHHLFTRKLLVGAEFQIHLDLPVPDLTVALAQVWIKELNTCGEVGVIALAVRCSHLAAGLNDFTG